MGSLPAAETVGRSAANRPVDGQFESPTHAYVGPSAGPSEDVREGAGEDILECFICHDEIDDVLIQPCACRSHAHSSCLLVWIRRHNQHTSALAGRPRCEVCQEFYDGAQETLGLRPFMQFHLELVPLCIPRCPMWALGCLQAVVRIMPACATLMLRIAWLFFVSGCYSMYLQPEAWPGSPSIVWGVDLHIAWRNIFWGYFLFRAWRILCTLI